MFIFLPLVLTGFYTIGRVSNNKIATVWLTGSSLFFYGYWNPAYVSLIICSVIFNYIIGFSLSDLTKKENLRKFILVVGIIANLSLLGYYKYANFFINNINMIFSRELNIDKIILPLAISFFTFQQIAFIVDAYKQEIKEYNFLHYCQFVTFFPQLIAGPIVHHKQIMPQFSLKETYFLNHKNISMGLLIFVIGLLKKCVIADTFAFWVNTGFNDPLSLSTIQAWATSFSYTFQLYFDFSGYADMAIGSALLFNIKLPINFDSPYRSKSIQEFWRRWHITLSNFLRNYLYIPLKGSTKGSSRTFINLMITMLLGGLWHGAGWLFIIWGGLHGFALVIQRLWSKTGIKMPNFVAWFITFNFINICLVFFRSKSFPDALIMLKSMFVIDEVVLINYLWLAMLIAAFFIICLPFNTTRMLKMKNKFSVTGHCCIGLALFVSYCIMEIGRSNEFLYFQF